MIGISYTKHRESRFTAGSRNKNDANSKVRNLELQLNLGVVKKSFLPVNTPCSVRGPILLMAEIWLTTWDGAETLQIVG